MPTTEPRPPVEAGQPAPDFSLPAANRDGDLSLADFRGKSPLLLAINRGLYCPFCRRQLAQLGATSDKLRAVGVETLAVVATKPERARLYLRFRPTRVAVAADSERVTHRAFGLPNPPLTPELVQVLETVHVNPTGELPEPVPLSIIIDTVNRLDGFEMTRTDQEDVERAHPQLAGQFLIDRDGIVRWANVECAKDGLEGAGRFPTDDELLAAARTL